MDLGTRAALEIRSMAEVLPFITWPSFLLLVVGITGVLAAVKKNPRAAPVSLLLAVWAFAASQQHVF